MDISSIYYISYYNDHEDDKKHKNEDIYPFFKMNCCKFICDFIYYEYSYKYQNKKYFEIKIYCNKICYPYPYCQYENHL